MATEQIGQTSIEQKAPGMLSVCWEMYGENKPLYTDDPRTTLYKTGASIPIQSPTTCITIRDQATFSCYFYHHLIHQLAIL